MRLKLKDLETPSFPNPLPLMCAWEHMGLEHIDFESGEVIHVSRSSDCVFFRELATSRRLSVIVRWDQQASPSRPGAQHSWKYDKGKISYSETVIQSSGETIWSKYSYNSMGLLSEIENSTGHKISIKYDRQGQIISVKANDKAKNEIMETYRLDWDEKNRILDCRSKHLLKDDEETLILS